MNFIQIAKTAEEVARAAGAVLMDWRGKASVTAKAPADLVTEADIAAEACVRRRIQSEFPDHRFLGEESAHDQSLQPTKMGKDDSPFRWIVDPLDGTTNFVHGLPYFCVSVAVEYEGQIVVGTIFDPVHDACFKATLGGGAFQNDRPISVSRVSRLSESLVVTGFPPMPEVDSIEVRRFSRMLRSCHAVRRMGSAALNMCHLAAGHFDAYWVGSLQTWDVAAGLLIIKEAGGRITATDGSAFDLSRPNLLATSTPDLHAEVLEFFADIK